MRRVLLFVLTLMISHTIYSQSYHCEIMNIQQPNNTTIEFDVYLYKTTTDTLYFGGFQAGINFNYAGLVNGGNITGYFVPNSSWDPTTSAELPPPQNAPSWNVNPTTHQIRMFAAIITAQFMAPQVPSAAPGIKIGTFRMINTVPFSSCAKPDFEWSFITGANLTKTGVIGWVNSSSTQTSWTTQTTFSYTNQGPEHFVQSNPSINPTFTTTSINVLACNSFTWQGNTYTTSGTYQDTLVAASGCDSILQLNLVIDTPTTSNFNQTACDHYTWPLSGQTYTTSGVYLHNVTQPSGCIHTDILNLTINNSTSSNSTQFACDTYTWPANSTVYYNSGNFMHTSTNSAGCPDTQHLALTIGHTNSFYDTIYNCNSIVWNGQSLTSTGDYFHLSTNASGCDSTTYLHFELMVSVTDTQTVHSCGPYTVANNTYISSGTYYYQTTNQYGCIINHVLYLTVGQNSYNTTTLSSCGSLYYNNTLFSTSGVFTTIMTNASGCDSIITLSVTIHPIYTIAQNITVCDSYTLLGTTYTNSGIYYDTVQTVNGCDSIIKLNLTVKHSTHSNVNQSAINSYTWSASGLTYYNSGTYVYTSTNAAGCPQYDTLHLTINFPAGINNTEEHMQQVSLYPNPTNGLVHLDFDATKNQDGTIRILDLSGRVVQTSELTIQQGHNELQFDLSSLSSGMYQFEVLVDHHYVALKRKVIKE